jgi:hypothetical protein
MPKRVTIRDVASVAGVSHQALNDVVLLLTAVAHTDAGWQFTWQTSNTGEYPTYVHVGNPPVIGKDGIVYGYYETPDIESVPITPGGEKAQWTTEVAVPQDVGGCTSC